MAFPSRKGEPNWPHAPNAAKNVAKPSRRIDAPNFTIADYECIHCGKRFRVING